MAVANQGIWEGLEDKMLELLRHSEKQAENGSRGKSLGDRVHIGVNPLLISLRDAVREGGDNFLISHVRAYEHRILELQSQIKERNRNFAHLTRAGSASSSSLSSASEQEVRNLRLEQDTWKLIDFLNKCELRHQQQPKQPLNKYFSEKEVVQYSKATDKSLDWNCAIVEWLESLQTPFINTKGNSYYGSGYGAGGTTSVEKLRIQTELQRQVGSIDPDTQLRNIDSRTQEIIDKEDESLLSDLWLLLRAGLTSRAIELCRDSHQHWRAASLGGGEYWFDGGKENVPTYVEGNRKRTLWRVSCFELAKHTPSVYERSIYGILAGNLDLVLKGNLSHGNNLTTFSSATSAPSSLLGGGGETLCKSWEDVCWARFKTQVSEEVDNKLFQIFRPHTSLKDRVGGEEDESCIRAAIYDDLGYAQAQQENENMFAPPSPSSASSSLDFFSSNAAAGKKFAFASTRTSIIHELEKDFLVTKENFSMRYHYILHQLMLERSPRIFAHDLTNLLFHPEYANQFFLPQNASFLVFIVHLHIYYKYFSATANNSVNGQAKGKKKSALGTVNSNNNTSNAVNSEEEDFLLAFYIVYLVSTKVYDVPDAREKGTIVDYFMYLPREKKIRMYAKFLQGLSYKTGKREHFLKAARSNFSSQDIFDILVQLVQNLRVEKGEKNSLEDVQDKINAIGWLVKEVEKSDSDDGNESHVILTHANYLFRLFWEWKTTLSSPTLSANYKPFSRETLQGLGLVLSDIISRLKASKTSAEGWEFSCWKSYHDCLKEFSEFSAHLYSDRHESKWSETRQALSVNVEKAVKQAVEVCAQRVADEGVKCVPELIDLLARTYMACGNYKQCLSLADDVADPKLCLYEFFSAEEMEHFLGTMRTAVLQTLPTEQVSRGYAT